MRLYHGSNVVVEKPLLVPQNRFLDFGFGFYTTANREQFVAANRTGQYDGERYDLIIGAVANDDVYRAFQTYIGGLITKEETLARLKIKKLFNQYVFSTQEAMEFLKFIKAEEVR